MANADCLTFAEMADYWMFCVPRLLQGRYERCHPIARSPAEFDIVGRMLAQYVEEAKEVARRAKMEGDEKTAKEMELVIQRGDGKRYSGPIRHNRFQVMGSLTPVDTFYIVDHAIPDLLLREAGPGSAVRRFDTREAAEKETDRLADRPAEITASARRRGGLDIPPSGKGRGVIEQETDNMARPKKAETSAEKPAPKKAGAPPAPKGKEAAPTPAATKGKGKNGAAPTTSEVKKERAGPGRKSSFDPKAKIIVVAKENPRRAGSNAANRYDLYKTGITVATAFEKGVSSSALADDIKTEVVRLG